MIRGVGLVVPFTVITVVKSDLVGLTKTMASVSRQTEPDLVHQIQTCSEYVFDAVTRMQRSSHQTVISLEDDSGPYNAMNLAARRVCKGPIMFLNAGDTLAYRGALSDVRAAHRSQSWSWAIAGMTYTSRQGVEEILMPERKRRRLIELGLQVVPHPSSFFDAGFLSELLPFDESIRVAADQELALRALDRVEPALLPIVTTVFAPGGISSQMTALSLEMELRSVRRARKRLLFGTELSDLLYTRCAAGIRSLWWGLNRSATSGPE